VQRVININFKPDGKMYFYLPPKEEVKIGDTVVVESEDGLALGFVASNIVEKDNGSIVAPLKKIIRKARPEDLKKAEENKSKLAEIKTLVEEKVKELQLDMKISNVDMTFDRKKVVIEFIADDRVDFRELLKQLASALKSRIELRQIGQRDEVKIKGGLGPCGQECCCHKFLKGFEHVSIKMAKCQGLALNPNNISGLCGKLMCCLGYENDTYAEIMKNMPRVNQEVETKDGKGKVVYNDILKEKVTVKMLLNGEEQQKVYDVKDIKFTKKEVDKKED